MKTKKTPLKHNALKTLFGVFVILVLLTPSSTVSQTTSNSSEGTWISYDRLNELNKFVEYKSVADSIIVSLEKRIDGKNLEISNLSQTISKYEQDIIPSLQAEVSKWNSLYGLQQEENERLNNEWVTKYKKLKKRRINIGPYAGYGLTSDAPQVSVGIGVSYTIFRI